MRRILPLLLVSALFALPMIVSAQSATPLTGPLVPCDGSKAAGVECQACHAVQLGQNIINFSVAAAAFIAVAIFAWAGFMMITAAGNTAQIDKARGMFTNVAFGLVITLSGWLIVDTVMKWVFVGSPLSEKFKDTTKFGPWNSFGPCVEPPIPGVSTQTTPAGNNPTGAVVSPVSAPSSGTRIVAPCADTNPYCSPEVLKAAGFPDKVATAMSCIAITESSGVPNGPCSKNKDGTDNACGLFQITRGNWENSKLHQISSCSTDRKYIYNATCNIDAALSLYKQKNSYSDWTGTYKGVVFNPNARACVEKFDPKGVTWKI